MKETVLITGASGGIGQAIAKELAHEGYSLYLQYNNGKNEIDKLVNELSNYPIDIHIIQADLSKQSEALQLVESIGMFVDNVIYCAGNSHVGLLTDMSISEIEATVNIHLTSLVHISKGVVPNMLRKQKGNIIVISSIWGEVGASCEVMYSTVKGAQNTFVKALSKEVAPSNIRVNAIAPGAINTKMMSGYIDEEIEALENEIPMGRLGEAKEVASVASFLISEKSSYITGQILSVNGGW